MTSSDPARVRGRGSHTANATARRGDETANNRIADPNRGNPHITIDRDRVVVAATFSDGSTQVVLEF